MTSVIPVQCRACLHLLDGNTCAAYPQQIPDAIAMFGADHRKAYPGDHGIRFTPKVSVAATEAFEEWRRTFGQGTL